VVTEEISAILAKEPERTGVKLDPMIGGTQITCSFSRDDQRELLVLPNQALNTPTAR
jgi:hypothetical protein